MVAVRLNRVQHAKRRTGRSGGWRRWNQRHPLHPVGPLEGHAYGKAREASWCLASAPARPRTTTDFPCVPSQGWHVCCLRWRSAWNFRLRSTLEAAEAGGFLRRCANCPDLVSRLI